MGLFHPTSPQRVDRCRITEMLAEGGVQVVVADLVEGVLLDHRGQSRRHLLDAE